MSTTGTVGRDEFFDSLLGDFLDESGQLLDRLNENLLQLDQWVRALDENHRQRCDEALLNDMFRSAHSLKGLSAMLGLGDINSLTHKIENIFDAARKDQLVVTSEVVELVFQAVDRLGGLVEALKNPQAEPVDCAPVVEQISRVLRAAGAERTQSTQADAERAMAAGPAPDAPQEAAPTRQPETDVPEHATPRSGPPPALPTPRPAAGTAEAHPASAADPFAGVEDEAEISDKYLAIFIDEAVLSLDSLTETLLAVEEHQTREAIEKLLVTSHRIKGSAASVGLNRAAKLAHLMEDLLQELVNTSTPLSPEAADAMLKSTDALRQYVEELRKGGEISIAFGPYAQALLAAREAQRSGAPLPGRADVSAAAPEPAASVSAPPSAGISEEFRRQVASVVSAASGVLIGEVRLQPKLALAGLKGRLVFEKLSNLGELYLFQPPAEQLEELEQLEAVRFALGTEKPAEAVRGHLRMAGVQQIVIEPLATGNEREAPQEGQATESTPNDESSIRGEASAENEAAPAQRADSGSAPPALVPKGKAAESGKPSETLRVDIERLDQLMNLAGELVINKAHFSQIGDRLKRVVGSKHTSGEADRAGSTLAAIVNELSEAIHQLDRVTDGIHQAVMDTRMVPIGPLFTRFKRVVRDITRTNGKLVQLVIRGEKTELDKRMIDELGDPLIHMVRNAADHGIELPEDRVKAGKPREGTITLDAFHRGNSIIIQVRDDGKGLDAQRILRKALERGLVTPADAEKMSPQEIYQLIWEPGLSTAEKVTEVSGRGMGMDIVKSKIADLNGTVELDSTPGQGTTMTIKLPLTLAILPSLMVEVDGDVFALPMEAVAEIVRVRRQEIATVHGLWTIRLRQQVVSVARLDEIFAWRQSRPNASQADDDITLVIVGQAGRQLGLAVDRVLGEEDVVIKSLAENYRNVAGIAGASILGDGRVSLILDLGALIEMAARRTAAVPVG